MTTTSSDPVMDRIHAAIAKRNSACVAAYAAMGQWQPVAQPEPEPFVPSDLRSLLVYHRAHAAMTRARATYYTAVAEADAAVVEAIEAAIKEAGE